MQTNFYFLNEVTSCEYFLVISYKNLTTDYKYSLNSWPFIALDEK